MAKGWAVALGLFVGIGISGTAIAGRHARAPLPAVRVVELRYGPRECTKKRVDPCGCHHVFGVRHCHPNRATSHCQAYT